MGSSAAEKIKPTEYGPGSVLEYLTQFLAQSDAGLIIGETPQSVRVLRALLRSRAMLESHSAEEALEHLVQNQSTFLILTPPLDTQLYYLLCQYARQPNSIQVMNRRNLELSTVSIEPSSAHLLFLVSKSDLAAIEERHPIQDKIGPIEQFS